MGVVLFWVHDTQPRPGRTRALVDRAVPLVDKLARMTRLPVVRGVVNDLVDLRRRCATTAPLRTQPTTVPRSTIRVGRRAARRGPRAGCASKTTKSAVVPSARLSSRPSQVRARQEAAPRASAGVSP